MNTTNSKTTVTPRSNRKFGISTGFVGWLSRSLAAATLAAIGIGGQSVNATNYNWDPASNLSNSGGAGAWDLTSNFWNNSGTDGIWGNTASDLAIFGGTGNVVTLSTAITAGALQFDVAGYTITSNTLTLAGTPTIALNANATIASALAGSANVALSGASTLTLSGANAGLTGGINVGAGVTLATAVTGASTTVTGTGVTTRVANDALGSGGITLGASSSLNLNVLSTVNQTGLSGRLFSAAPLNNDSTNVNFSAAATSTRYDANLNRYDLTTASGGGTAITPTTSVAIQWTGKLNITNAGGYRFFVGSDDGSRLFVDGVLVVNNDGSKGTTDLGSQSVSLSAGLHDIRVDYTQGTGGGSTILSWAGGAGLDAPAIASAIPQSALFTAEQNSTGSASNAVIIGSGTGDALAVGGSSTVNLNGTAFTQAQMGGLTNTGGSTLTVNGLAGKTLRFAGASTITGSLTINSAPDVALDGTLAGTGATIIKQGAGRLIFDQSNSANTLDAASLVDVQGGTAVLVNGTNSPIGAAGLQLNGGNVVLDSVSGPRTLANNITVAQSGSIQSIVSGASATTQPIQTLSGTIGIGSGATLTLDAIAGGVSTANNPTGASADLGAQITASGVISGAGNLAATSTSFGSVVTPGTIVLSNGGNSFSGSFTLNGTIFTGNTSVPINGPTLRVGAAGALPSTATSAIFVKSGILDFATNNVAYSVNAGNVLTLGGGPATTTSNINVGTGALTVNNDIVYDASTNSGVATIKGNGVLAQGNLDLNTAGLRTFNVGDSANAAFDLVITSPIIATGGGGILKTGAGTLAIQSNVANQANTYTGLTQVAAGTLYAGGGSGHASNTVFLGAIQVDSGATLRLGASNIIGDTSLITVNGTYDLNGFSDSLGTAAGSGVITSGVGSGALTGLIRFDMSGTNAVPFTGSFTGQVAVGFRGLNATIPVTIATSQFTALSYAGDTLIGDNNGTATTGNTITLQLSSTNAIPFGFNKGDLRVQGSTGAGATGKGVFDLNGFNQTVNGLIGNTGVTIPLVTNNGTADSTLTVGAGATSVTLSNTFAGIIQNGGTNAISIVKNGIGTQVFTNANTYTGTTVINNGALSISNVAALGSAATGTVVNTGGILNLAGVAITEPLTLNGKGQPNLSVNAGNNSFGLQYTGALTASGSSFSSAANGSVLLASNSSIGAPIANLLTIGGIISDGGNGYGLTIAQGGNTGVAATQLIGTGATSLGPGIVKLTAANTFTGSTTVVGGDLWLAGAGTTLASTSINLGTGVSDAALTFVGTNNQLSAGTILNFNNGSKNTKFQLNGTTQTVAGFTGTRENTLSFLQNHENAAAGAGTIIVNNPSDTSYYGYIRDQNNTLSLTKQGAGTLLISGDGAAGTAQVNYTGATSVTAGKLIISDTTSFTSPITLSGTGSLEFNYNYGRTLTDGKTITDNGLGFTKSGLGNLILSVASTVTGTVNVTGGSLILNPIANASALPGTPINVSAGGQLDLFGIALAAVSSYNNPVTLNGYTPGGALLIGGINGNSDTTLSGQLTLAGAGVISNVTTGWADHTGRITGKITGAGVLQFDKQNYTQYPPTIQVNNTANDYSGGTIINGGSIYFTTGSLPSAGALTFGGYSTASGQTTLNGPTLVLGTNGLGGGSFARTIGTAAGNVAFTGEGGGFSAIGAAQTVTFNGGAAVTWGAAGLDAGATLWFNGSNSLASAGVFNADNVVTVTNDIALGSGMRRVFVVNNNTVTTDWAAFSGAISGSAGLIKDGGNGTAAANLGGILVLNGSASNTYTGLTNVIGGAIGLQKTGGATAIAGDVHISNLQGGSRRIVYLGASDQIADTSTITFAGQTGNNGDFRLFGFNETVGGISDRSGGGIIEIAEVGDTGFLGVAINNTLSSTLTVGGTIGSPVNTDSFYNGFLRTQSGGTGVLNLIKNGSGTLTISQGQQSGNGNASYNGTTTINGGTLQMSNIGTYNSVVTINSGANLAFNTNINQSLTDGQVISGVGAVQKNGIGTMILSGATNYSGLTTVNGGVLQITGAPTGTGGFAVNSGGVLLVGNATTAGAIQNAGNVLVNAGGVVAFSRNDGTTYSGIISGAGDVQSRAGTTGSILSGANTYSGSTTVLQNAVLSLAGDGASAGGLNVNSGGTLTLNFNLAGANAAGIAAATAPVNLNGGTLTLSGSGVANTQTLGAVTFGTALPGNFVGLNPTQPGLGASTINLTSGAGGLNVNLGAISHTTGGTANVVLPTLGTVTTTGTAVGGIANGFTTTSGGTTWLAQDGGGVLTALAAYGTDSYGAGVNTDVVTGGAAASTNSVRFNTAAATTATFTGSNTIDSGGILVTATVGANTSTISGGSIAGSSTAGLTVIQNNPTLGLTINSVIADNGGATGLTKAGTGTLTLSGTNTYTGPTFVSQGTLVTVGANGGGITTVAPNGVLQIGDGVTNGVLNTLGVTNGIVVINNVAAQTVSTPFNATANFNYLANAISNGTSFQVGVFSKTAAGTLTITSPIIANQFHQRAGTTILDTGTNVIVNGYNSIGQFGGDSATLTIKGAARITDSVDFNVSDISSSRGIVNVQDQGVVIAGNFLVGKNGTSVGVVNQTLGSVSNTGGNADWRIGGNTTAGVDTGAYGIYNLSGGSFQTGRNFQTGASGLGVFNQTGGTVSITGGTPDAGRYAGSFGLINISNGTYTNSSATNVISGESGTGTINVSGAGQLLMPTVATANIGLALGGASGSGTVNLLSGGLIQVGQVRDFDASTATQSNFNFNGGTLRVTTGTVNSATFMTGLTAATVYSGGANIDTNGVATTIGQALVVPAGSGLATIPVATGGSGYAGEPIVNITGGGGTGATARATVVGGVITGYTITNPGTGYTGAPTVTLLGGGPTTAGTVGTATTVANTTTGGLTKLNTGALTLTGTSTYGGSTTITGGSITESFTAAASNILPATGLVINGGSLLVTQTAAVVDSQTFAGVTLNAPGAIAGTIFAGGTVNVTLGAITKNAGGAVDIVIPATGFVNTSTANTLGIIGGYATFASGANWAVGGGNISAYASYTANTATTWTAAANTDQTVATTGLVGASTTNSVRFNTATPLTVVQAAATTSTIVSGGILITPTATTAATLFSGGTIVTGGTNTDLVIHDYGTAATAFTISSIIGANGTGGLVKTGAGLIISSGVNTYAGATAIGGGTLRLGTATTIPDASVVTIGAGATLDLNNFSETIGGLAGYGTVTTNVAGTPTLTVSQAANSTFSGTILNGTGTGTVLTKTGAGTLTLNNVAAGTYTGATNINAGAIKISTPAALSNNTTINVNVAGGLLFDTTIPTISGLGGNSTFALTASGGSPVQLTVGNNSPVATYSGALTGAGTIIKIGTGTQTLSGTNTSTGGFVVNAGTLVLSGNNSGASGAAYANSGGTLQFSAANSVIGASGRNVVVAAGGTLTLGVVTANTASVGFGSVSSIFSRVDQGSTGALALQADGTLQTPVSENLDFAAAGLNLSLGATLNANTGNLGNSPVQYTGVITPNASTFRLGGGGGRLILPNAATMAGANGLVLFGATNTGGQVFLTAPYTFTGATTVNAGTTYVTTLANAGSASSLGASTAAASNLIFNGGTLSYVGAGSSTDRLFTLSAAPTALDSSGSGPVSFTGTGAVAFLNSGNRTFIVQGTNTGANSLAASIGDSLAIAGTNGTTANGITTFQKNGNGTWILSGTNTFSGGVLVNNGVLGFSSTASIGANTVNGPASVNVTANGAVGLFGSLTTGIQTTLNRISPLSAGTVALTADSAEAINFDGGSAGAGLPTAFLGAYGNVAYTGTLTPFANQYRLGGGGGVLTIAGGGLTGPRAVLIGGGGPGTGFVNNPNLNGAVVLGGTSDYTGGTQILAGGIVGATSLTALGSGPLKFQGGVYRAVDATDISLASDGVSARDIRFGADTSNATGVALIDVASGVNLTLSKPFGTLPTYGSNQGTVTNVSSITMTKYGAGVLTLNGLNLATTNGVTAPVITNSGLLTIERGTLILASNPTYYAGRIDLGSNSGGVATLKLGANNVFANGPVFGQGSVVDTYGGSQIDLAGFSDTFRLIRGTGSIINTGASTANITMGTANENGILAGNLVGNFTVTKGGQVTNLFGTGATINGLELWSNNNTGFTGKFVVNAGALRLRSDGSIGATTETFAADKITLNNNAVLLSSGAIPLVIGANHGITLGSGGGTIWQNGSAPMVINAPITGSGTLTIANDAGTVYLNSDSNSYTGGTVINSTASTNGFLSIGAGGSTGSLPAGDVLINSNAGTGGRLYLFKSTDMTVANNINGANGIVLQIGAGTTTMTGNNTTGAAVWVGGGRLKADFSTGNAPIGTGVALNINGGAFEYVATAGTNTLRLGALALGAFTGPPYSFNGGLIGDSEVKSTYNGSGSQLLEFASFARASSGSTMNFITNGGTNGSTNSIAFSSGAVNNIIGAAFFYNGADFAALDVNGFVRAANFGADANTAPLNTFLTGKYSKLTTSLINQGPVSPLGIELAGANVNLNFANSGNQTTPFTLTGNPSTILKSGGGGIGAVSVVSGGTMALGLNPQTTTAATLNNNGGELILRANASDDFLQVDMPIAGAGALTKSGNGTLILTAANNYTGTTFVDSGTVQVTSNGILGGNPAAGTSVRIANSAGSTAVVNLDSATASIVAGLSTGGDRLSIGEAGTGTLNQTAGTVNANQSVVIGDNLGASGTYNISAGTLNVKVNNSNSPLLTVGRAGTGALNISGTAAINVKQGAQIQLGAGISNGGNFQGLTPNAGISTGVGTITQTGGTVTVDVNNGAFQSNTYGAVILGVDGTGTYNLNGGTLITPVLARGNGTANFNLGAGTLRAPAATATLPSVFNLDLPINLTGTGAGKGTIDTNSNNVTVTSNLTGAGGFVKASAGVLNVLGSASNYSGGTDINAGSIVAAGSSLGTGVVNVAGGATLTVQGVQQGLLARFFPVSLTSVTPGNVNSAGAMSPEFATLSNFNTFLAGKALVAAESTAARGKTTLDYLDLGGANGITALPPQVIALSNGSIPFVSHLAGSFNAATTGDYTFQTRSDDGSAIWIDGAPVVDNDRNQGQTTRTGTINLSAGPHSIVIGYFQGTGGGGFSVGVTQPGQGQSYQIGSELNMSNTLLSYGSNNISVGGLAGAGDVVTAAGGTVTDTVATGSQSFSGRLLGTSAFSKAGAGKQILSGNSSAVFTGAVNIAAGELQVDGSISASTVGVSGTLSGSGTVGDTTASATGIVAPGSASPGTLNTGVFTLVSGSGLSMDINTTSSYDKVNVTGAVNLGSATLTLGGTYLTAPVVSNDLFFIVLNDGGDAVGGTFNGVAEGSSVYSIAGQEFQVFYGADSTGLTTTGGNDVALLAVPEPGSVTLMLGGLAMIAGARRRRKQA